MTRREFASILTGAPAALTRVRKAFGQPSVGEGSALPPEPRALPYRNPNLPIEQRTADLLGRMTLDEKVEQLRGGRTSIYGIVDPTGTYTDANIRGNFQTIYGYSPTMSPHDQAVYRNALQRYAVEKTRLGIPQIFQCEALHGYGADHATVFPGATALGGTWDPDLIQRAFTAIADEAASTGANQVFTPTINLARDPRWAELKNVIVKTRF